MDLLSKLKPNSKYLKSLKLKIDNLRESLKRPNEILIKKLENVGGQNPIEAAKLGCKIYHGPYVYNFQEIYNLLNSYKISEQIANMNDLSKKINFDINNLDYSRNENALKDINELGEKILTTTFEEIVKLKN